MQALCLPITQSLSTHLTNTNHDCVSSASSVQICYEMQIRSSWIAISYTASCCRRIYMCSAALPCVPMRNRVGGLRSLILLSSLWSRALIQSHIIRPWYSYDTSTNRSLSKQLSDYGVIHDNVTSRGGLMYRVSCGFPT
jgi:hypothetical protein